jgi:mono/diheme cytochrome c family protein
MTPSRSWTRYVTCVIGASAIASACGREAPATDTRAPAASTAAASGAPYRNGLADEDRRRFYHLPEGGELFPVDWLLALETDVRDADGKSERRSFVDTMERFGLLPDEVSPENPYGLPVGVTVAKSIITGLDTVGVNCAACHVGELTYGNAKLRIDGGPNMVAVPELVKGLMDDSIQTLRNPARLASFVKRARAARERQLARREGEAPQPEPTARDLADMVTAVTARIASLKSLAAVKAAETGSTPAGYGRTDAFGTARNELFSRDATPPTAPVSLPHIWGMEHTAWLQWGANTNSVMQRNIGQILGTGAWTLNTMSSIKLENLGAMEDLAYKIQPPRWPDAFPPIDKVKAAQGRELYGTMCATCHDQWVTTPTGLRQFQLFTLDDAGTDRATAVNFEKPVRTASGAMKGFPDAAFEIIDGVKEEYYKKNNLSEDTIARLERRSLRPSPPKPMFRAPLRDAEQFPDTKGGKVYPAKSLAGIWATAPYLHNGSVPTMYDLLLPAAERPKRFSTGQREYDPVRLGYQQDKAKYRLPPGVIPIEIDTTLPGNSNAGHEWKVNQLTEDQRWAIVEYLKTL